MKLVVGLGNIGSRYAKTRHNIGFMVVDALEQRLQDSYAASDPTFHVPRPTKWENDAKLKAAVVEFDLPGEKIVLAKPQTMMNASGEAVQRLMQKYRLAPADVWVIYDDVDVDFGKLRLRDGGASGQQGVKSIIAAIGTGFKRVRMGISLNDRAVEPSEVYVLKPFSADELAKLPTILSKAAGQLAACLGESFEEATIELN